MIMSKLSKLALSLFICSAAVAQTTKPAAGGDKEDAVPPVLETAITALTAEFEAVLKDPAGGTTREKSDYFLKTKDTVDESALLKVLASRINKDVRVDSYIKWQLISIQKGPFSEQNTKPSIQLYRKTPMPPVRPGSGNDGEMVSMLSRVNKDNYTEANQQWQAKLLAHDKTVLPMLGYRDELYGRLVRTNEVIRAGFDDADQRSQRGYEARTFITRLSGDLRSLAAGSKPVEINQMASLVMNYAGKAGNKAYNGIKFDDKSKKAAWETRPTGFDKKAMDKFANDLKDMSKSGF